MFPAPASAPPITKTFFIIKGLARAARSSCLQSSLNRGVLPPALTLQLNLFSFIVFGGDLLITNIDP